MKLYVINIVVLEHTKPLLFSHAAPWNGGKHWHCPVFLLHLPLLPHSATACALLLLLGTSANAFPAGHTPVFHTNRHVVRVIYYSKYVNYIAYK